MDHQDEKVKGQSKVAHANAIDVASILTPPQSPYIR